ncbi:restriction endonuclease subunit S [Winogradskyella sp. UBA3174]|uniref:restriction endonuclease subunit S n=1 Tax=Winogradskyella sp. UBA3174 TaxID=1947785 RepID=UPI0025F8056B|nr:restriction endonuclease subunit S [Winogradskyella sp. UBA3174]|tara:strand:- start:141245 stop:142579 length:1335 start_codon:yes stop_codon:yes gene_type:complete
MEKNLPKNWVETYLYEIVQPVKTGVTEFEDIKDYYSTGSIKESEFTVEGKFNFKERPSRANREVYEFDILQARMENTDKAVLIDKKLNRSLFSTGFIQLRSYGSTIIPKYTYYFVKSEYFNRQKNELASGTTQVAINDANAKKILFPLPPLAEQQRIVAKLGVLFDNLEVLKTRLDHIPQLLKNFRQAVLTQALKGELTKDLRQNKSLRNWEQTSLGLITELITSGSRGWAKYYSGEGAIFVRAQNINKDFLDLSDVAFVKLPNKSEGIRSRIFEDDLLITITGANVTKTAIVDFYIEEAYVSQHVSLVRLNNPDFAPFIYMFLINESHGRKQLIDFAYGQGKPQLNLSNIKDVKIDLPSKEEQTEIVKRVEALFTKADKIETQYQSLKIKTDSLPQAILAKAFKGELVEQLDTDGSATVLLEEIKKLKELLKPVKKSVKRKKK